MQLKATKNKLFWNVVLTACFFAGFSYMIFCGHYYEKMPQKVISILACMTPVLIYKINFQTKPWQDITFLIVFLLLFAGALFFATKMYTDSHFQKYGMRVVANVVELKSEQIKSNVKYSAIVEYTVNGNVHKQSISNDDFKLQPGDTIGLTVSSKDPELYK